MLRLESDLVPYLLACATGRLHEMPQPGLARRGRRSAWCWPTEGYPGPGRGRQRDPRRRPGLRRRTWRSSTPAPGAAPTARCWPAAGRVLNVCAAGADLAEARERAYAAVAAIDWPQGFHRTDIGWRALAPLSALLRARRPPGKVVQTSVRGNAMADAPTPPSRSASSSTPAPRPWPRATGSTRPRSTRWMQANVEGYAGPAGGAPVQGRPVQPDLPADHARPRSTSCAASRRASCCPRPTRSTASTR